MSAGHGFDAVTVTRVAGAADVAEKTVYNHFPRKTGLFFDEADDIPAGLLRAGFGGYAAATTRLPVQVDDS